MTDSTSDELGPILKAFKSTLVSIDLRCIAVSLPSEDCWRNLVTSIFLSDGTIDEVRKEQKALPKIHNNSFALFHDAIPFDYSVLEKITEGQLKIPFRPVGTNRIQYREANLFRLKVDSFQAWKGDVTTWRLRSVDSGSEEDRKELWSIANGQSRIARRFRFNSVSEMIGRYLNIDNYRNGDRKDIEIVIPSPARIESLQFGDKKVEVILKKTPKLDATLHMNLALNRENREVWRDYREVVLGRAESKSTPEVFEIQELESFDLLSVELLHRDSSLTLDRDSKTAPLLRPTEPFLKTLESFCTLKEFRKMLFEPEYGKPPQDVFEDAIAWLLSLAGFDVIRLRLGEKKFEHLYVGKKHRKGSVDIIAYEENERILLIECTTGPVDPVQVQRLADVKKYFRRKLKGYERLPIVSILFFSGDFRKTSPSIDVMIADHSVIARLFRAVVRGDHEKARSILNYSGM